MKRVYLDTNAFRYFGAAFASAKLDEGLADRILTSPLSAFEVMAQLAGKDADVVLQQIHAIKNWTNPKHSGLLPWPDDVLYWAWFGKVPADDGFTKKMEASFNFCLSTGSVDEIKAEALGHKQLMDGFKIDAADDFTTMLTALRKGKHKTIDVRQPLFEGIAKRVKADPQSMGLATISTKLSAHFEYEQSKLQTALKSKNYNPQKHRNDIIDAEQLVYLADSNLILLTSDGGFKTRAQESPQKDRIITRPPVELRDAKKATLLLKDLTS